MAVEPIFESYGNKIIGVPNNEESGGSGGHVIENSSGTDLPQEDTLQFADSHVTDDSTNSKTVVETFKALTSQEYAQATEDGAYIITDGDGAVIEPASEDYVEVVADGVKTYRELLDELFALIDLTKITFSSNLSLGVHPSYPVTIGADYITFSSLYIQGGVPYSLFTVLRANNSSEYQSIYNTSGITTTDISTSNKPTTGTKLTLYYGNKKAVVDLQTTASRCLYDSNTTVKQKIDDVDTRFIYERRIGGHGSLHFILSTYSTGAIISCAVRDAASLLMVFSNGWLNIVSNDTDYLTVNFDRNNYREFTITNSKNDGGYVSIITRARVEFL